MRHVGEDAARRERGRIGTITNRSVATIIVVANFVLGIWVALANNLHL